MPLIEKGRSRSEICYETGGQIKQKRLFHFLKVKGYPQVEPESIKNNKKIEKSFKKSLTFGRQSSHPNIKFSNHLKPTASVPCKEAVKESHAEHVGRPELQSRSWQAPLYCRFLQRRQVLLQEEKSSPFTDKLNVSNSKWQSMMGLRSIIKVRNMIRGFATDKSNVDKNEQNATAVISHIEDIVDENLVETNIELPVRT